MKKIISLIAISILLTSCGEDTIENETLTGTTSQSGSQIEENIDQSDEENLPEETQDNFSEEEISQNESEVNENMGSQEDYETSAEETMTPESQENNQTASGTITLEVEASADITDTQEEQLIQETMDELNEFFELLEETNG